MALVDEFRYNLLTYTIPSYNDITNLLAKKTCGIHIQQQKVSTTFLYLTKYNTSTMRDFFHLNFLQTLSFSS